MSGTFKRHLLALLRKNALLKRRNPCSFCLEIFLGIGAVSLLAVARVLSTNIKASLVPVQYNEGSSMPVHLPECAEYVSECSVELVKDEPHSPMCLKGVGFGCQVSSQGSPGVWASLGCSGTFDLGGGLPRLTCASGRHGRLNICPAVKKEERSKLNISEKVVNPNDKRAALVSPMMSLLGGSSGDLGMRRLDAVLGIAPADGGGREFRDWLVSSGHPWASNVKLFASPEELQEHLTSPSYPERDLKANKTSTLCAAVVFDTSPTSPEVHYTLRFNRSLGYDPNLPILASIMKLTTISTESLVDARDGQSPLRFNPAGMTWYTQSGFLSLQRSVDTFIEASARVRHPRGGGSEERLPLKGLASWVGEDGRPHFIVPFPTPGWRIEVFSMVLPQLLGSFLLISLLYSLNRMITGVVHEREARLRDGMRMMGMHPAAFYASWVLTYVGLYMFVVLGITLMLSWGRILPLSSPSLLFVWLMLFSVAAIAYALVISTFFSKAKTAATVGSIVFFSSSYLRHLAQPDTSPRILRLLSLLPPVCFELASDVYGSLESQQVGITWANAGVPFNNFSVQESCWMLALDAVLLFLLFLYLDQVMPREIGLQRKWYFPLLPSFWAELCGSLKSRGQGDGQSSRLQQAQEPGRAEIAALIEPDLGEAAAWMSRNGQTVELRQLSKHFGALRAVEALDLVMYQGEIFALLGHNGAGKTTTLAVLCGLMAPSSGSCSIFGHDGGEDAAEVQRLLGVCPQHDVLWEELTCEEHMTLFAGFKGVPHADVAGEVSSMLQRVGLHRAGTAALQACRLSGGMKRKLSLGIAFLGGSRLVVLDEPTSGLDPYSRRTVWELLRAMKQGRVTVLSTHYMDEADILGDRIAILHEGRLRCCGSPQFLKRAYDCGYNVSFVKRAGCSSEAVHEAVCRHVPELTSEVTTLSDSGKELILQFPFAAARHFPKVLGELEQQMEELLLESYGISVTTLEEVFLKVASGDVVERTATDAGSVSGSESISGGGEYVELAEVTGRGAESAREVRLLGPLTGLPGQQEQPAEEKPPGCCRRPVNQMRALIRKRWRYGLRDKRAFLCQMLLPTTTLVLFLAIMSVKLFSRMPPLELSASGFNEHCVDPLRGDGVQNVVDFTYLPFMGSEEAQAVLEPGKPFWKGDLRRCDPNEAINEADANEEVEQLAESEKALDETLATVAPGLLRNIMKPAVQQALISKVFSPAGLLTQSVRGGGGRRLEQLQGSEEISEVSEMLLASFEKQLLHMSVALWARATRLRQGAEALAELAAPGPGGRQWLDPILRQQVEPGPDLLSEQEPDPDVAEPRRLSLRRLQQQQHQQYQQQQQHQQQQQQQQQRLLQGVGEETSGIDDTMPPAVGPPPTTNNNKHTMAVQEENNKYNDDKTTYNYHYNSSVRPVRFMGRKGVGFCPGAGSVERMIWSALELDTKGKLTREDLRETLEKLKLSVGGKAMDAKLHSQAGIQKLLASEKLKELLPELQESGLLAPKVSSEDQLGELFGDAVFLALDQNQDGVIDEAELCAVGKAVRTEVGRYLRLARQFSKQILTGASKCSRYGAYYVIAPARTADTADWVAGAEAVVFVNTSSSHAAAVFQAALTNARLSRLGLKKAVSVKSEPFPATKAEQITLERVAVFLLSVYITFCLSFIPSGIANFIVKERATGARQLQALSGASHLSYWAANLSYDVALYIVPALSVPISLHFFGYNMLLEGDCGLALAAVLAAFGPAVAGFAYLVSFLFKDHSKASNAILSFCLIGAIVLSTVLFILSIVNYNPTAEYPSACDYPTKAHPEGTCLSPQARQADRILGPIFRLVPTVCLYQALFAIALVANIQAVVPEGAMEAMMATSGSVKGMPKLSLSPFAYEWAGEPLRFLLAEAVGFFVAAVLLDTMLHSPRLERSLDAASWFRRIASWRAGRNSSEEARLSPLINSGNSIGNSAGDDSVEAERERAAIAAKQELALHVWDLEKVYRPWFAWRTSPKRAVRGVSFAIHSGEVFGLLGHNGAGKTSAIKCFVGEQCCTAGAVHVGGFDMERDTGRARQRLGYCPQFDALLELLTVQDHLELFASIRGLPKEAVESTLVDFKLVKMAGRRADLLSGGNKRKLSAAIALMGSPALAILDEPSCGLDPAARRALWTAVTSAVAGISSQGKSGRQPSAVLLTTHSMEEAEALSNRLGIMADGQLLTVGTAQQIKQRHGSSHELCVMLRPESEATLAATLYQLGNGAITGTTGLDHRSIGPLLEDDPWKRAAYLRPRCVVRAQIDSGSSVEAAVLAEWWLQQARGEAIEKFLQGLLGDRVELAENFGLSWRFRLPRCAGVGLPALFQHLEEKGKELGIAEYTLSQATLEQIFNTIAESSEQAAHQEDTQAAP